MLCSCPIICVWVKCMYMHSLCVYVHIGFINIGYVHIVQLYVHIAMSHRHVYVQKTYRIHSGTTASDISIYIID